MWAEAKRTRNILRKAASRIKNLNVLSAWNKWRSLIDNRRDREAKTNKWVRGGRRGDRGGSKENGVSPG